MDVNNEIARSFLLPNALWGSYGGSGYQVRGVNSRSSGITESLSQRIVNICQAWPGDKSRLPSSGAFFQLPIFPPGSGGVSYPGESLFSDRVKPGIVAASVRSTGAPDHGGRENAVWYHALYIEEDVFASMEDQCFGLWGSGAFRTTFEGAGPDLPHVEVRRDDVMPAPFLPLPQLQADALSRCLEHVLLGGDVVVPGLQPDKNLMEHLRLLFLGLPRPLRMSLGVNTFGSSPRDRGSRDIFVIGTQWKPTPFEPGRELLVQPPRREPAGAGPAVRDYVMSYRDLILAGDLYGLLNHGRRGIMSASPAPPAAPAAPESKRFLRRIFG